ncbi:hypothetical protein [Maricaulis sp.]|uniref:hypothetical protein n=1 Tax=Maricaulis sp. TaxID=1486257 RepID=UPI003A8E1C47
MQEFEARADHRSPDIHDGYTIRAIGRYQSKADYVRAEDLGLTQQSIAIDYQVVRLQTAVHILAGVSVLGLIGAVIAALDFMLDTVTVPGLQPLIERGFGCDPEGGCLVVVGLPLPVLAGLVVSGVASLLAICSYLRVRIFDVRVLEHEGAEIASLSQSIRSKRFVYLGSGQLTYRLGDNALQVSTGGRIAIFEWSTFDGTLLLHGGRERSIWPNADPAELDGPQLDLLFARKERSEAVDDLRRAAQVWSGKNTYIDLPLRLDLSVDANGRPYGAGDCKEWREVLRIHSRYFHGAGDRYLSWADFVAACAFMIAQCDHNFSPVGDETR